MKRREEKTTVTSDRVVRELARIAFSNQADFSDWGAGGVILKESRELKPGATRAVAEVTETKGKEPGTGSIKIKLHDKVKALDLLGRHLGIFKPQEIDMKGKIEVTVTDYRAKK